MITGNQYFAQDQSSFRITAICGALQTMFCAKPARSVFSPSFTNVNAILDGGPWFATLPAIVPMAVSRITNHHTLILAPGARKTSVFAATMAQVGVPYADPCVLKRSR